MATLSTVLLTISIVLLADSLFVFIFPKFSSNLLKSIIRHNHLKKFAIIEFIVAIILLLISLLI